MTQIAAFSDFHAWQLRIAPGQTRVLQAQPGYALCMGVSGRVDCAGCRLQAEDAALIPQFALPARLHNSGTEDACVILAAPRG